MLNYVFLISFMLALYSCGEQKKTENTVETSESVKKTAPTENQVKSDSSYDALDGSNASTKNIQAEAPDITNIELNVYLDDPDSTGTNIRQSPGGKLLMTLIKDDINIEYFFTLTEARDGWFKIKGPIGGMEEDIELTSKEAWIHSSVISVDSRNYGGQAIEVFASVKGKTLVGSITQEVAGIKVKDMHGKWVKIDYNGLEGWVDTKWLCGNPLTTCS